MLAMAMDMIEAAERIQLPDMGLMFSDDPEGAIKHVRIRVGVHSGPAFAGVVGIKTPRYCARPRALARAPCARSPQRHITRFWDG
jgi:class 3 adenylate cyclase